jgi:hypothetical protein
MEQPRERAWPFENVPEGGRRKIRTPQVFVAQREGAEAVVVRIGLNDTQLVLVDGAGAWDRWVYHSEEEANEVARALGIEVHQGHYPEALRVRMNARVRPPEEFDRGAYPEQGRVGPVMPYPENRPRRGVRDADRA